MATARAITYPSSDGKPMTETDWHFINLTGLVELLKLYFHLDPHVYVAGNMFIYYVPGNKRKHVSPDVFVVFGVEKHERPYFLVWEEGKAPSVIIEFTSFLTRREDLQTKFRLYRDVLKVREYFLFDPLEDYLEPSMQGYRLRKGEYVPIKPRQGWLPSSELGLHLERDGWRLRLYNPEAGLWLPTPTEARDQAEEAQHRAEAERDQAEDLQHQAEAARDQAEAEWQRAEASRQQEQAARQQAEAARQQEEMARQRAEAEAERLRQELEALRRQPPG